jgi:signal transduction histidine kinase
MKVRSLRLRLIIVGVVLVASALIASSAGVVLLFERHVIRRALAELVVHADQISAGFDRDQNGEIGLVRPPGDPRFDRPLSGLYWQITIERDGRINRSRSLWDHELVLPPRSETGRGSRTIAGPGGVTLLYIDRRLTLPERLDGAGVRVVTALDRREIREAVLDFLEDFVPSVVLIGALLLGAALAQVYIGLRPLGAVRQRLADVTFGRMRRVGPGLPEEVQPLAVEIDGLLDDRDRQIAKARERSADLAHALKTPLQVLTSEAERLGAKGEAESATILLDLSALMNRQVQRELARARIGIRNTRVSADVGAIAARVVAVVRRIPTGESIEWCLDLPTRLMARIDEDDLAEALGNLLENAATHANSRVMVTVQHRSDGIVVTIVDDGAGIPEDRMAEALSRGGRLDTKSPGAGLGLSIVSDIAEAWGIDFKIEDAGPGLRAILLIPAH